MILFAYAANMDMGKFVKIVPSAKKIDIAKLPGYDFVFGLRGKDESSKASITPSADLDAAVWGVLIELSDDERDNFFNPDPETNDLILEAVTCIAEDGKAYEAEAFIAKPHAFNSYLLPFDWYHERIIKLTQQAGLPHEYIDRLTAMPFKKDTDEQRAARRRKNWGL